MQALAATPSLPYDPVDCPFVIDLAEAARTRFARVTQHSVPGSAAAAGFLVTVALPASFEKKKRRRYPLILLPDAGELLGSAIEMARLIAVTREARECIVVSHDDASLAPKDAGLQATRLEGIIDWCRERFRVESGEVALFVQRGALGCARQLLEKQSKAVDRWILADSPGIQLADWTVPQPRREHDRPLIAWAGCAAPGAFTAVAVKLVPEATPEGLVVTALMHGIRSFWSTGHAYGAEMMPLSRPFVSGMLRRALPVIRRLRQPLFSIRSDGGRHVLHSEILDRNFEIFVTLPSSTRRPAKGYPAMVALDANGSMSTVSEVAARMAGAGEIEDIITIGIGVPRAEGDLAFGLRRFAELSPPAGEAAFDNPLGRFFEAVFAMFGLAVREHFGLAPLFHRFVTEELLPQLLRTLPLDASRLCMLGHSAAGTYIAYELVQADSPFSSYAVLSPGVAISDGWMLKPDGGLATAAGLRKGTLVTMGGEEQGNAFNGLAGIPLSRRYAQELQAAGGQPVEFQNLAGDTHTTVFPRALALALSRHFPVPKIGDRACSTPSS